MGSTISSLIRDAECGDGVAADELFSTPYSVLHWMAKQELARRGSPASLSVTTLLHEVYLDIAEREGNCFPDRPRFMGYAVRLRPAETRSNAGASLRLPRSKATQPKIPLTLKNSRRVAMHWISWLESS